VQSASTPVSPQFGNGFTVSGLALNGGAKLNGSRLQLTDGGQYEAHSAFFNTPVNVERFTTEFSFQLTQAIADGFTFTIQGAGPTALGSPASGLGFGPDASYHVSTFERSINHSVAVKFDLFDNAGEGKSSIGLFTNGVTPTMPAANLLPSGIDLHSGHTYKVRIVYYEAVLALTFYDTTNPSLVYSTDFTVDIPGTVGGSTAYVGFTAGTGASSSIQEILQWNFSPVPNYASGFSTTGMTLNGGASVTSDNRLRLTDGGSFEARTAYFSTPVNIATFTADFTFKLTAAGRLRFRRSKYRF
jgi:hypothetical protein